MSRRRAANLYCGLAGQVMDRLPLRLSHLHSHASMDKRTFFIDICTVVNIRGESYRLKDRKKNSLPTFREVKKDE
ncbi:MAG: hypothetical protein M0Z77_01290 [Thermoplasmatales archaeon]|nr:hypothetical protein [Thermoplasmatales archaeon]